MERFSYAKEVQTAYERLQHPLAIYQFINNRVIAIVLSDGFCELFGYENQDEAYKDIVAIYFNKLNNRYSDSDLAKAVEDLRTTWKNHAEQINKSLEADTTHTVSREFEDINNFISTTIGALGR